MPACSAASAGSRTPASTSRISSASLLAWLLPGSGQGARRRVLAGDEDAAIFPTPAPLAATLSSFMTHLLVAPFVGDDCEGAFVQDRFWRSQRELLVQRRGARRLGLLHP